MIYAYTGKTGSGKTFNMVLRAYLDWKQGRDIYSNTILFFEKYGGKQGEEFTSINYYISYLRYKVSKKILNPPNKPTRGKITYFESINELIDVKDGVILIDEAQVLFNARNWDNLPYEFQYKLQQHRKHQLDMYCTTQNIRTIDLTYRMLVQGWYHHYDKFALFWKRNPSLLTIHTIEEKDIDELWGNPDEQVVTTIGTSLLIICKWRKRLYDTMYDIGFKRFKTIWVSLDGKKKCMIIPKQMKLQDVLRRKSSLQSALGLNKSRYSKKN